MVRGPASCAYPQLLPAGSYSPCVRAKLVVISTSDIYMWPGPASTIVKSDQRPSSHFHRAATEPAVIKVALTIQPCAHPANKRIIPLFD